MSKRFLGKVAAGTAAVAGAFLLVAAPGVAQAATPPDGRHDKGCIVTYPKVVKPGHEVKIIAKCDRPQLKPWAWSEVTGKVWLKPWHPPKPAPEGPAPEESAPEESAPEGLVPDGSVSDGMSNDQYSSGSQSDESWAGEADGRMSDRYGHGHKDGIDPRRPADAQPLGDPKVDGKVDGNDYGHGHKDGIDPRRPADAQPLGEADSSADAKADDSTEGTVEENADGNEDGVTVDGRRSFVYWGKADVYKHAKPGKYWIKGSCGFGRLIVAPKGWVDGGDGGTTGTNTGLAAGGATALAAAAVGGIALVRRRKADGSLA